MQFDRENKKEPEHDKGRRIEKGKNHKNVFRARGLKINGPEREKLHRKTKSNRNNDDSQIIGTRIAKSIK